MTNSRLLQILLLLLEKGQVTAPELAEQFETSVRTIYRDIDGLSAAGVPVYTTQGKGGGIFLNQEYVLNKMIVSSEEQKKILMALQELSLVENRQSDELLKKLSGLFKTTPSDWLEIDFSAWGLESKTTFDPLKQAIFNQQLVRFSYMSRKGELERRTVEPVKLIFKNHDWYLQAFCQLRQDIRLFKLLRIRALEVLAETFEKKAAPPVLMEQSSYSEAKVSITLLFDASMAYEVYERYEKVLQQEDGRFLVTAEMPHNNELYRFLLSLGDQVEVVAPTEVREELQNRIKKMKQIYET
ncbi:helix-turn-helix transcriptional regulator [Enterococcus sp. AZ109]|uniref:helix-turn-helix transcriptional regulator n=1 Tax=Enterococcus sp. AZ109 TaxID=2774634 RepID=UPI003F2219E1